MDWTWMLLVVSFLVTPLINPSSVSFILKFTYSLFTHNFRTIVKKWTYVKKGHSFDQEIVEELHSVLDELRTQLESRHDEVAQVAREWWYNGRIIYMEWSKVKKKDWSCKKIVYIKMNGIKVWMMCLEISSLQYKIFLHLVKNRRLGTSLLRSLSKDKDERYVITLEISGWRDQLVIIK